MIHVRQHALPAAPTDNAPGPANTYIPEDARRKRGMSTGNIPLRKYWETMAERGLALLEPAPLMALAEDMGDPACAVNFLGNYFRMLPGRMRRISTHVNEEDSQAAMDALLSLKVTSAMVGAQDIERKRLAIETQIGFNQLQDAFAAALSRESSVHALSAGNQELLVQARADLQQIGPAMRVQ